MDFADRPERDIRGASATDVGRTHPEPMISRDRSPVSAPARAEAPAHERVTIARTVDEIEELRSVWERLQGDSVTTDIDYFSIVVAHEEHMIRPHVILVEGDEGTATLVVGRLDEISLPCKVGYRSLYTPRLRSLTVAYGGLLGDVSDARIERIFNLLRETIDRGEADVLSFRQVRPGSPFHRLASEVKPSACRQLVVEHTGRSYELALPATYDDFLGSLSSRTRANVRTYGNRLRRDYEGRLELRVFSDPAEIDELFTVLGTIADTTYQTALGRGFRDDAASRARTRLALERGWYRAWVLSLDGAPAAFWSGIGYRGRFMTDIPGFDPRFRKERVGTFVLCRAIEDLCAAPQLTTLDFGFGDAEYKRHFATSNWEEETRLVYARRLRPMRVNLTRTAILTVTQMVGRLVERMGWTQKLKTGWRRRLAAGADTKPETADPKSEAEAQA